MNPIDRLADYFAKSIRKHNENAGSEIALKYALSLTINTTLAILITILICSFTGHLDKALLGIGIFLVTRYISGGVHMTSSLSCCVTSILIFLVISHVPGDYNVIAPALDVVSFAILAYTAPNNIEGVSRIDPKYYPVLKILTLLLIASNFYFQTTVFTAAFFIQAVLTTKFSYKIIHILERKLQV